MKRTFGRLLTGLCLLLAAACSGGSDAATGGAGGDRPLVITTFHPTDQWTRRIAGERCEVRCGLPPGADPLHWSPSEAQVLAWQDADLIVLNGAGMEGWLQRVSLPPSRLLDTSASFASTLLQYEHATTHRHGGGEEHTHQGTDAHVWMDPRNARHQCRAILAGLQRLLPARAEELAERHAALDAELARLDDAFTALGEVAEGASLYASHPAYNYLARRYGWPLVNLSLDPGAPLDDATVAELRGALEERPGRYLLWEAPPLAETAARLERELGLRSVVVAPCENPSAEELAAGGDWLATMRRNVEALRPAFAPR